MRDLEFGVNVLALTWKSLGEVLLTFSADRVVFERLIDGAGVVCDASAAAAADDDDDCG